MKKFLLILVMVMFLSVPTNAQTLEYNGLSQQEYEATQSELNSLAQENIAILKEIDIMQDYSNKNDTKNVLVQLDKILPRMEAFRERAMAISFSTKEETLRDVNASLGGMYYTKGLIYAEQMNNLPVAQEAFVKAAKYDKSNSKKYAALANRAIGNKELKKAEMYLSCYINTTDEGPTVLMNAYKLRGDLRSKFLGDKTGANYDYQKVREYRLKQH